MAPDDPTRGIDRRTLLRRGAGAVAATTAVPALAGTAAAHFPDEIDIDVLPGQAPNVVDADADRFVSVRVSPNDEFDPHQEFAGPHRDHAHYRFGYMAEDRHGVRPRWSIMTDEDDPGVVLIFPLGGTGFPDGEHEATLKWEREVGGHHGLSGTDTVVVENGPVGSGNGN
ncbi:hypothetical protein [Haloglomus halophilum]|uniref:hypothetical protein n=1 Tax=Haloglomus halophilum TaxID=2962672 RepID=UPI0020C959A5|nr:hypothetical protein [Haloglomus halophilum]